MHLLNSLDHRYIELEFSTSRPLNRSSHPSNHFLTYSQQLHRLHRDEVVFDFSLINRDRKPIHLHDRINKQPTVLCIHDSQGKTNLEMERQAWENALPTFTQLGIPVFEIVPSLQHSFLASMANSSWEMDVLIDAQGQVLQAFALLNSPVIAQCASYPASDDQLVCFPQGNSLPAPEPTTCIVTNNQVFLKSGQGVDPIYYLMLLDPDYWLALV